MVFIVNAPRQRMSKECSKLDAPNVHPRLAHRPASVLYNPSIALSDRPIAVNTVNKSSLHRTPTPPARFLDAKSKHNPVQIPHPHPLLVATQPLHALRGLAGA